MKWVCLFCNKVVYSPGPSLYPPRSPFYQWCDQSEVIIKWLLTNPPGWCPFKCWRVSWSVLELPALTRSPQVCSVSESCLSFRKHRWLSPAQTYWYTISRIRPSPLLGTDAGQHWPLLFLLLFPLPQPSHPAHSIQHQLSLARLLLSPKPLAPAIFPGQHHLRPTQFWGFKGTPLKVALLRLPWWSSG